MDHTAGGGPVLVLSVPIPSKSVPVFSKSWSAISVSLLAGLSGLGVVGTGISDDIRLFKDEKNEIMIGTQKKQPKKTTKIYIMAGVLTGLNFDIDTSCTCLTIQKA